jgi:hypothetical protein
VDWIRAVVLVRIAMITFIMNQRKQQKEEEVEEEEEEEEGVYLLNPTSRPDSPPRTGRSMGRSRHGSHLDVG